MKYKKPPIPVLVLLILIITIGGYYGIRSFFLKNSSSIIISGTIEAAEITISPESAGKVVEVLVDEGDEVKAGDLLFRLDDSLLLMQRELAAAGLDTARAAIETAEATKNTALANYNLVLNAARSEAVGLRTQEWNSLNLPGYGLPGGYFSQDELIKAAQDEINAAKYEKDKVLSDLDLAMKAAGSAEFLETEATLLTNRMAEQTALDVLNRAKLSNDDELINAAQDIYDNARAETESAQSAYDEVKESDVARTIISARLRSALVNERYESAQDRLLKLQFGTESPKLQSAQAALIQAEKSAKQVESSLKQAEAQLNLLDFQISKLRITAPRDGVILTRNIQPGEVISLAGSALKLGILDQLTIVVYVPEDIYGTLSIGEKATLRVDSFPGQVFNTRIMTIADKAEFTPRNVQTIEGRKATVFAVKLAIEDSSGKLKPGMPADVTFEK